RRKTVERGQRPDCIERDLVVAQGLGNRERPSGPLAAFLGPRAAGAQKCAVGVRRRELPAGRQLFENVHRFPGAGLCLPDAPRTPEKLGQTTEIVALLELVASGSAEGDRLLERSDALLVLIRQDARSRAPLADLRAL